MRNIWTIMHKELVRVFKSPTMLLTLLLPGLIVYGMFALMGAHTPTPDEIQAQEETYVIVAVNMPQTLQTKFDEHPFFSAFDVEWITDVTATQAYEMRYQLATEEISLIAIFDANFETQMLGGNVPMLRIFSNQFNLNSRLAQNFVFAPAFMQYRNDTLGMHPDAMVNMTIDQGNFDEMRVSGGIIAEIVPMMILMLLFSVAMSVVAESVAGEKERGTIATLLATPVKRSSIALGKIGALTIVSMLSAISSFAGLLLSLPSLMRDLPVWEIFGFGELSLILLILASSALLIVGVMSVVSAFAKNIKEATMMLSMFMIFGMGAGIATMIVGIPTAVAFYFIPFFNTAIAMASVVSLDAVMINMAVTIISNVIYTLMVVWFLSKLFNSEKIMFSK